MLTAPRFTSGLVVLLAAVAFLLGLALLHPRDADEPVEDEPDAGEMRR